VFFAQRDLTSDHAVHHKGCPIVMGQKWREHSKKFETEKLSEM